MSPLHTDEYTVRTAGREMDVTRRDGVSRKDVPSQRRVTFKTSGREMDVAMSASASAAAPVEVVRRRRPKDALARRDARRFVLVGFVGVVRPRRPSRDGRAAHSSGACNTPSRDNDMSNQTSPTHSLLDNDARWG